MKRIFQNLPLNAGAGLLAVSLCSCSLFRNGRPVAQWEIQSEVPSSLSSGQASSSGPVSAAPDAAVQSDLSGHSPAGVPLDPVSLPDLPALDSAAIAGVPKPDQITRQLAAQSPPELLNAPAAGQFMPESASDAGASGPGGRSGLQMHLPAPPSLSPANGGDAALVVTEEELPAAAGQSFHGEPGTGAGLTAIAPAEAGPSPESGLSDLNTSGPPAENSPLLLAPGDVLPPVPSRNAHVSGTLPPQTGQTPPPPAGGPTADRIQDGPPNSLPAALKIPWPYGRLDLSTFLFPAAPAAVPPAPSEIKAVPVPAAP